MVSAALAGVLASRRMEFNRRVAEARHRTPGLDTGAFSAFVGEAVNAVCTAVDAVDPAATPAAVDAAFDIGLDLVAQGLAGPAARRPWVDRAWLRLAPATARLLARAPLPTLAAITNAVVRLGAVPGVRVDAWIAAMAAQAGRCERLEALRDLGALCAWRAGMAHLRQPALAAAARLDPALAAATCRVADAAWPAALQRLQRERWWDPGSDRIDPQGHTVGGFTGFGGPFATPPDVRAGDEGFVVAAGDRHHVVIADAFGAVVLPGAAPEFAAAASAAIAPAFVQLGAHGVSVHGRTIAFAVPTERLRAVAGNDSVALFSPWSHTIRVVPAAP